MSQPDENKILLKFHLPSGSFSNLDDQIFSTLEDESGSETLAINTEIKYLVPVQAFYIESLLCIRLGEFKHESLTLKHKIAEQIKEHFNAKNYILLPDSISKSELTQLNVLEWLVEVYIKIGEVSDITYPTISTENISLIKSIPIIKDEDNLINVVNRKDHINSLLSSLVHTKLNISYDIPLFDPFSKLRWIEGTTGKDYVRVYQSKLNTDNRAFYNRVVTTTPQFAKNNFKYSSYLFLNDPTLTVEKLVEQLIRANAVRRDEWYGNSGTKSYLLNDINNYITPLIKRIRDKYGIHADEIAGMPSLLFSLGYALHLCRNLSRTKVISGDWVITERDIQPGDPSLDLISYEVNPVKYHNTTIDLNQISVINDILSRIHSLNEQVFNAIHDEDILKPYVTDDLDQFASQSFINLTPFMPGEVTSKADYNPALFNLSNIFITSDLIIKVDDDSQIKILPYLYGNDKPHTYSQQITNTRLTEQLHDTINQELLNNKGLNVKFIDEVNISTLDKTKVDSLYSEITNKLSPQVSALSFQNLFKEVVDSRTNEFWDSVFKVIEQSAQDTVIPAVRKKVAKSFSFDTLDKFRAYTNDSPYYKKLIFSLDLFNKTKDQIQPLLDQHPELLNLSYEASVDDIEYTSSDPIYGRDNISYKPSDPSYTGMMKLSVILFSLIVKLAKRIAPSMLTEPSGEYDRKHLMHYSFQIDVLSQLFSTLAMLTINEDYYSGIDPHLTGFISQFIDERKGFGEEWSVGGNSYIFREVFFKNEDDIIDSIINKWFPSESYSPDDFSDIISRNSAQFANVFYQATTNDLEVNSGNIKNILNFIINNLRPDMVNFANEFNTNEAYRENVLKIIIWYAKNAIFYDSNQFSYLDYYLLQSDPDINKPIFTIDYDQIEVKPEEIIKGLDGEEVNKAITYITEFTNSIDFTNMTNTDQYLRLLSSMNLSDQFSDDIIRILSSQELSQKLMNLAVTNISISTLQTQLHFGEFLNSLSDTITQISESRIDKSNIVNLANYVSGVLTQLGSFSDLSSEIKLLIDNEFKNAYTIFGYSQTYLNSDLSSLSDIQNLLSTHKEEFAVLVYYMFNDLFDSTSNYINTLRSISDDAVQLLDLASTDPLSALNEIQLLLKKYGDQLEITNTVYRNYIGLDKPIDNIEFKEDQSVNDKNLQIKKKVLKDTSKDKLNNVLSIDTFDVYSYLIFKPIISIVKFSVTIVNNLVSQIYKVVANSYARTTRAFFINKNSSMLLFPLKENLTSELPINKRMIKRSMKITSVIGEYESLDISDKASNAILVDNNNDKYFKFFNTTSGYRIYYDSLFEQLDHFIRAQSLPTDTLSQWEEITKQFKKNGDIDFGDTAADLYFATVGLSLIAQQLKGTWFLETAAQVARYATFFSLVIYSNVARYSLIDHQKDIANKVANFLNGIDYQLIDLTKDELKLGYSIARLRSPLSFFTDDILINALNLTALMPTTTLRFVYKLSTNLINIGIKAFKVNISAKRRKSLRELIKSNNNRIIEENDHQNSENINEDYDDYPFW